MTVRDMGARLKRARQDAGFASGSDAARHFGWKVPTYLGHENGSRQFGQEQGEIYAKALKIDLAYLMLGKGDKRKPEEDGDGAAHKPIEQVVEPPPRGAFDETQCMEMVYAAFMLLGLPSPEARNLVEAIQAACHKQGNPHPTEGYSRLKTTDILRLLSSR